MLEKKWITTPLLDTGEQPEIPIVEGEMKVSFRRFRGVMRLLGLFFKMVYYQFTGRLNAAAIGQLVGDFCQRMGVLWVKVGQLMSMRSDLFPPALCNELARLQDRVEGFSPQLAADILGQELGGPLERFFSHFERHPFAAASIAQVHRAYLKKEKVWVAVKVRRPEVDYVFEQDMGLIRWLFMTLHRLAILSYMRWPDMLLELEQVFNEELDYRYEISNQRRIRKTLANHDIYVPRVYKRYCTRKVIVMEYIEAASMAEYLRIWKTDPERLKRWREANGIDDEKVGKRLFHSYIRQVLEDNLFHADLHPGNILLLRDNRIALLDFGSVGTNEGDLMRKYDVFLESLGTGRFAKAIDVFLLIMPELPAGNLVRVREELQRRLLEWDSRCRVKELSYNEKSTNMVFDDMMKVMGKYGVTINWAFFKVIRGWTTLDTSMRALIPQVDLPRLTQDYMLRRKKRVLRNIIFDLPEDLLRLQNLVDYPREFSEMAIYRGATVRRLAQVFEGTATRLSRLTAAIFNVGTIVSIVLTILFGIIFLGQHTAIFSYQPGGMLWEFMEIFPRLDVQVWLLLFIFILNGGVSFSRLSKRFLQQ